MAGRDLSAELFGDSAKPVVGRDFSSELFGTQKEQGFFDRVGAAAKRGIESLGESASGVALGAKAAVGATEAASKQAEQIRQEAKAQAGQPGAITWEELEKTYGKDGAMAALKKMPAYLAEQVLQSAPSMALPLAVGAGAGAVSGPLAPIVGPLAGIGTYGVQQFGQFMQRQAQEGATGETLAPGKAALTAAATAPIGYFADRLMLGAGKIPEKILGEQVAKELAKRTGTGIAAKAAKGATVGVIAEAPTEVLEQMAERWQAGLPLKGEEAMREYKEAFAGAAAVGGVGGAGSRAIEAAKDKLKSKAKTDAADIIQKEREAAAPIEEPPRVQPVAETERAPTDIGELERQFGMAPPSAEAESEAAVQATAEPVTESVSKTGAEAITQPTAETVAEPVAEPVAETEKTATPTKPGLQDLVRNQESSVGYDTPENRLRESDSFGQDLPSLIKDELESYGRAALKNRKLTKKAMDMRETWAAASDAATIAFATNDYEKFKPYEGFFSKTAVKLKSEIGKTVKLIKADEAALAEIDKPRSIAEEMEGVPAPHLPEVEAEVERLTKDQEAAAAERANLEKRTAGTSLIKVLKGTLSDNELSELGGRARKVGKNPFLNLKVSKGQTGSSMEDMVDSGKLDIFLPERMRPAHPDYVNSESAEYIRDKLRNNQFYTYETELAIQRIDQDIESIDRQIQDLLTEEEINKEIQYAVNEQRELDQAASEPAAAEETGAAEERAGEEEVLTAQTEEDLKAKQEVEAAAEKKRKAEEKAKEEKAKADEAAADFVLTGSDRAADQAAARGQMELAPAEEPTREERFAPVQKLAEKLLDKGTVRYEDVEYEGKLYQARTRTFEGKLFGSELRQVQDAIGNAKEVTLINQEDRVMTLQFTGKFVGEGRNVRIMDTQYVPTESDEQALEAAEKGQTGYSIDPEEQRVEKELTGKTMVQAADWAIQNAPNAFLKTIAEKVRNRLRELERRGVKLEFEVVGGDRRPVSLYGARGYMQPSWGDDTKATTLRLVLNGAAVLDNQRGYPPGTRYSTVLHELLHVATRGYLQFAPLSDPLRRQMRDLTNAIIDRFNSDAKDGKLPPVMQKYYKRMNNVLESDDEVLAWGLTDEDVQKYFADIKVGEKSVMTRLVELVRSVLGLGKPYESALDRLVKVSESMLDMDVSTIDTVLGNAGKRLGRAAPTTGEQQALFQKEIQKMTAGWTDGRIQSLIKEHGYSDGRTKAYAAFVDPDEFVNGTTPSAKRKSEIDQEAGELDLEKIRSETQTPFLFINQINKGSPNEEWEIVGHEGRHRMSALSAAGVRRAPVILVMQENGFKSPGVYEPFSDVQVAGQSFDTGTGLDIDVFDGVPINKDNEQKLKQQFGEGEILYQQEGRQNVLGKVTLGNWTLQPDTKLDTKDSLIYKLLDKNIDLKRVVQAVQGTIGDIGTRWNPYLQEELYHGRTAKQTKDFMSDEMSPLIKEMDETGVTIGELEQYLQNRHAEAYNKHVAKVNPNKPDMQDGGSGIKTEDAKEYLDSLPKDKRKVYEKLAKRVDSITKGTRELLVKSGLEKKETIDAWEKTFPDYVPLMREEEDFEYTTGSFGVGRGYDVRGPSSKAAMGSKKKVIDILANVALARERAIVRAEKNRVAQALYGLAVQAPNPEFWLAINPIAEKIPESAIEELRDMGIDESMVKFLMKEPRQRMLDPKKNEVVERINTTLRNNNNVMSARVNGENRYVFFNPNNERAKRAATALKNLDAQDLGTVLGLSSRITRFMASVNTQYNPIFGAYNFLRDVQGASLQLSTTPLAGKGKEVRANILPAIGAIFQSLRKEGKGEKVDTEMGKLWQDFQKAGGQTGFRDMYSRSQDRAKALIDEFEKIQQGKIKKGFGAAKKLLSDYNDTMENAVRLAAYKVALDEGNSRDEAASIAKNLTVNFNRKGDIAVQTGALYAFFNAAMQGSARLLETLRGPAGQKIIAGGLLWGVIQSSLLAMAGFDEEEPPEFVRERNFIMPIFGTDKYVALPMPLGYHVIPGFSRQLTDAVLAASGVLKSSKTAADRVVDMTGMFLEAFNPIGNAGWSFQTLAPTPADPIVALFENRDWTGKKIYREDINELRPTPGYTRAKDTANYVTTKLAEYINLATGGTKYQKGAISPTPEHIEFLIGQALGGVGREGLKLGQTIEKTYTGEDLPSYKIPLVGRFYGETKSSAAEASRFYKNLERINSLSGEIKGRKDNKEPLGDFIQQNPEARLAKRANEVYSDIKKLRERKEKLVERNASRESVKAVETQITNKMRMLNEQVDRLKK